MQLSAIVIAKNGEDVIEDCLRSISFCDEIIVIDGGSVDATVAIAKKFGAKIITETTNNFAEKRNIGLRAAKGEWVLYVDTDERVSPSLRDNIKSQISNIKFQNITTCKIKRKNFYLGNHEWTAIEKLERLFKKDALKSWKGQLHESPEIQGEVEELDGFLLHYTHRDLASMLTKTNEWSAIEAKLRYDTFHPQMEWWRFFRVMWTGFSNSYIQQGGWKVGTAGLIESMYQGFSMFVTYAKLWEMQEKVKNQNAKVKN